MAQLSFGVNGPTMQFTVNMQIQDTDAPRILAYLASTPYGVMPDTDGEGNPTTRAATTEECARNFAAGILAGLLDQTLRHEQTVAAAAAAAAIQPITPVT